MSEPFNGLKVEAHPAKQLPWKVLGTQGSIKISVNGSGALRVEVGGRAYKVDLEVALVLGRPEAQAFIRDPAVAPYLYGSNERESRMQAAEMLAAQELTQKRRDFVAKLVEAQLSTEGEAWVLAKIKYPG